MKFFEESIPTKKQLIKRYGFTEFPTSETDDCCGHSHSVMDFITHRVIFHKLSVRETMEELEEFMKEIWIRDMEKRK